MTYLEANVLGIEEWEREGLIKTIEKLKHIGQHSTDIEHLLPKDEYFNIYTTANSYDCGTVACIGGWTYLLNLENSNYNKSDFSNADDYVAAIAGTSVLEDLYYPAHIGWHEISNAIAIAAIENFLKTGQIDWIKAKASVNENSQ